MNGEYIHLSEWNIALAGAFVLLAGIVSAAFRLGLLSKLVVGAVRTALQLLLAGLALSTVFGLRHPALVLGLAALMVGLAVRELLVRLKIRVRGTAVDAILTMSVTTFVVAFVVTAVVVGAEPWWTPPVFIPLLGMIIGNSLNGISLSLDRFLNSINSQRHIIEGRLALGATPNEAVQPLVRDAIRTGMIPMMNAMAIVGVVSLPGMMTGQLLAGADPMDAVLYQIVVMYMIAAAVALGSSMVVLLVRRRVFNEAMAVRTDLGILKQSK
jgi:putative ABC transport system permease protein